MTLIKNAPETRLLWKASALLALSIPLGIAAAWGGIHYRDSVQQQIRQIQNQLVSIRNKKATYAQDLDLIKTFKPRYETFEAKGVINQEPRLTWLDTIDRIGKELNLPQPVRYKLDVRKPFDAPFTPPRSNFILHASTMTLNISLLHEGDLFDFFTALEQRAQGMFSIPSCAIRRTETRYDLKGKDEWTTALEADCVLNWFTLWNKEVKP
ncbi:MAG: hypothetical protein HQL84_04805 [Magnetococcales bacterium]|nr:hypothetical protein [Magnetococcales bacterium]MBF0149349.1 hypothetical protein [Magnetococcales bacterium]MBF0175115.1 hypothetical protein [Magnetococcales bacterium]MBF0348672.1 hypothetical protein [Magnetococcales bacterium]MBF0632063.1 hypothetical protein [Magnetococcales bacterium]